MESKRQIRYFLIFLLLLGLILRLKFYWFPLGWDEGVIVHWMRTKPLFKIMCDYSNMGNHLFHTFLLGLQFHVFGDSLASIRFPSLLAGMALIPACYSCGKKYFSPFVALISGTLAATSAYALLASGNARGYVLQALFLVILPLLLYDILERPQDRKKFLAFVLVTILSMYTLPTSILVVPALFIASILFKKRHIGSVASNVKRLFAALCIAGIITLLLYLPITLNAGVGESLHKFKYESSPDTAQQIYFALKDWFIEFTWNLPGPAPLIMGICLAIGLIHSLITLNPFGYYAFLTVFVAIAISFNLVRFAPSRCYFFFMPWAWIFTAQGLHCLLGIFHLKRFLTSTKAQLVLASSLAVFMTLSTLSSVDSMSENWVRDYARMRGSEEVVLSLGKELRENDFLIGIIPQYKYWIAHHGFTNLKKLPKPGPKRASLVPGSRIFFTYRYKQETFEKIEDSLPLALRPYPIKDFDKPVLYKKFQDIDVYFMTYRGLQLHSHPK